MEDKEEEMKSLLDIHTHRESIFSTIPEVIKILKEKASPDAKCWNNATVECFLRHIKKNNLDTLYTTFQNPEAIIELREKNDTECKIRGMYYIKPKRKEPHSTRFVLQPSEDKIHELHERGLVQGIKLHPVMDYYELTSENLEKVLILVKELKIPILFHSDNRKEFMELTSPSKVKNLIKENPSIDFIIGHGGAYIHQRNVGSNPSMVSYWQSKKPYSQTELIINALRVSRDYKNAYYDLTICSNRVKAKIITDFLMHYPKTANKILVGTDFPLLWARAQGQIEALEKAGLPNVLLEKVIKNRPFEKS